MIEGSEQDMVAACTDCLKGNLRKRNAASESSEGGVGEVVVAWGAAKMNDFFLMIEPQKMSIWMLAVDIVSVEAWNYWL